MILLPLYAICNIIMLLLTCVLLIWTWHMLSQLSHMLTCQHNCVACSHIKFHVNIIKYHFVINDIIYLACRGAEVCQYVIQIQWTDGSEILKWSKSGQIILSGQIDLLCLRDTFLSIERRSNNSKNKQIVQILTESK